MNPPLTAPTPKEELDEVEHYLESRGIYGDNSRRKRFLSFALRADEQDRLKEVDEDTEHLEEDIKELPQVNRLHALHQLAGKTGMDPKSSVFIHGPKLIEPAFHSRFAHCELLALLAKHAGVKLKRSNREIRTMMTAGWLHDIGHSALSHVGDDYLTTIGYPDHEERTIQKLDDPELEAFFEKHTLSKDEIVSLILEDGALGEMQSALDTLSYVILDSAMIRMPVFEDQGAGLIDSLVDIDSEGHIVCNNPERWRSLLEARAKLFQSAYRHPVNHRSEEAMRQLIRLLVGRDLLQPELIRDGTDSEVRLRIQSLVQHDPGAAMMSGRKDANVHAADLKDLYGISLGFFEPSQWGRRVFEQQGEAEAFLMNHARKEPDKIQKSFVLPPFDYTKKTLTLRSSKDGSIHTLKALETKPRHEDFAFVLYHPHFTPLHSRRS